MYQIETNRILFVQNLWMHFDISHLCERSKCEANRIVDAFFMWSYDTNKYTQTVEPKQNKRRSMSKYDEIETMIGYGMLSNENTRK